MPNDSRSRRDKKEKERKRKSKRDLRGITSSLPSERLLPSSSSMRERNRNNSLSRMEDEEGSSLSDGSEEVIPLRSLSPSQFVGS
jgi:hypothetical protein